MRQQGQIKKFSRAGSLLPSVAVIALAGTLFLTGAFAVHAQDNSTVAPIVQAIADKFHLNVSDVKAVFEANRQNRMTQMEERYEAALDKDVTDGKITDAQKQLIIAKHKELMADMKANLANLKNMSPADRKIARDKQRTDLQTWATQNGIDLKFLMGGFAARGHRGMWVK